MLEKLSEQGFNGNLNSTGCYIAGYGNAYCIFDERLYDHSQALIKLQNKTFDLYLK